MKHSTTTVLALATLLAAAPIAAQQAGPAAEIDRGHAISFSPILALFEILQAEYEVRLGKETTGALGVGWWAFGDEEQNDEISYLALDLKGRFYPDEALEGFAIGGTVGAARIEYFDDEAEADESTTGFAFGVELSRAWLLGDERRWFLAAGVGAKRYIFDEVDDDVPVILPTGRLGFGLAF